MNDIIWQSLPYLNLLWAIVPVIALFAYASWRNRVLLARFAHQTHAAMLTRAVNHPARIVKRLLVILGIAALAVALARPAWNKSSQPFKAKGRDVVFILDISRSMLASHRSTTRLEEAKFAIQECLSTLRGDRVALIIFAGNAKIACPLTHDTAFFLSKLSDVDYRSVTYGGTMLGDAIRLAINGIFKNRAELYRDVIVITDGEDMQSNPIQAAEQLADIDARLIAVGMGDDTPTPLVINTPDGGAETIMDNGSPVMTKLDSDTLLRMAEATAGGIFIPVHSDTLLNLNDIYKKNIESQLKRDFESHDIVTYEEKFQIFLVAAMLLFLIARLLPDTVKTTPQRAAMLLGVLCLAAMQPAVTAAETSAIDLQPWMNAARQQLDKNDNDAARTTLEEAADKAPESPYPVFNLGVVDYREGKFTEARERFQKALRYARQQDPVDTSLTEACNLAIASCAYTLSQQETNEHPVDDAKSAVSHFKEALAINPENATTHSNLNLAKTNYKVLRRKQQEQQQQQQGDGKDNDKKDDQQDQDDQQKQQGKQGQQDQQKQDQQDGQNDQQQQLKQLEQEQRQAAEDMNNSEKSQQDLQQQQQDLQQKSQQAAQQQQAKDDKNEKAEDFLKEAAAKQQEAKEHLEKNEKEQAQQAQKEAADMTQMARQALQEQQQGQQQDEKQQQEQQPQEQQAQEQQAQEQQQPKDNDNRAQDAINLENLNKLNRQKHQFTAPAMQNKDW